MAAFDLSSNEVLGAILGSVVGGGFALLGVWYTFRQQQKAKDLADLQARRSMLMAVRDEVSALVQVYETSMRDSLQALPPGMPLLTVWPVSHERFVVYEAHAVLLGSIPDDQLRSDIVQFYILAGGLIATFRFNNELIARYENFDFLSRHANSSEAKLQADCVLEQLTEYAPKIRARDQVTVAAARELVERIGRHIEPVESGASGEMI